MASLWLFKECVLCPLCSIGPLPRASITQDKQLDKQEHVSLCIFMELINIDLLFHLKMTHIIIHEFNIPTCMHYFCNNGAKLSAGYHKVR